MIKNLFSIQNADQRITYFNNRLSSRRTFVDWEGSLMGPIHDVQGLEQGGVNSSDHYKIFAREQLDMAQRSALGVPLGKLTVSAIGQADDTVLVSNDIGFLSSLLSLTVFFCEKYLVQLCPDKTKLQAFARDDVKIDQVYPIRIGDTTIPSYPIRIGDTTIPSVDLIRSTDGNLPSLMSRFSAHKKSIASLLHTGLAKGHRANPATGLFLHKLYGTSVLFSVLASLVLSEKEIKKIDVH